MDWKPPNVGSVVQYLVYRFRTDDPGQIKTLVGQRAAVLGAVDYFLIDTEELPNDDRFTYYVVAQFVDDDANPLTPVPESGPSNFATVTAVNDPPVANDKIVPAINEDSGATPITLVATDDDSASCLQHRHCPSHGTLTGLSPNVTYTPYPNYFGPDSFSFKANAGSWSSGGFNVAMSSDSNEATVSITVNPVNDVPSFTKGDGPDGEPKRHPSANRCGVGHQHQRRTRKQHATCGPTCKRKRPDGRLHRHEQQQPAVLGAAGDLIGWHAHLHASAQRLRRRDGHGEDP